MQHYDTIFFNKKRAKKIAKQNNPIIQNSHKIQICYYFGNKQKKNLIPIQLDNIKKFFISTNYRWPKYCDFNNSEYANNEEIQNNIVKAIAKIFDEITKEQLQKIQQQYQIYQNLKVDKKSKKVIIFASKNLEVLYDFAKLLQKQYKSKGYQTMFITETSKKNYILDEVQTLNIFKTINQFKPTKMIFINDFKPQLHHKFIKIDYYIDSFKKSYEISEYEESFNMTNVNFYVTSYYHYLILKEKNIIAKKFIIPNFTKFKSKRKTIDLFISELIFIEDNIFLTLQDMKAQVKKHLQNGKLLDMNTIQQLITQQTLYTDSQDWELNLYLIKTFVLNHIIKYLKTNKKVLLFGKNKKELKTKFKMTNKYKKTIQKSKYVLYIHNPIITPKLDAILQSGAIPIVYDLRDDDKFYDHKYDDKIIFFKNVDQLNQILNPIF